MEGSDMKLVSRETERIKKAWVANEISWATALMQLTQLGWSIEYACKFLAKT